MLKKLDHFIRKNQAKFLFLVVVYLLLSILSELPFFGLIISPISFLFVLLVLTTLIFNFRAKSYLLVSIIFLLLALIALLVKLGGIAEIFGNLVFGFIFLVFVVRFYSYIKNLRLKKVDI